MSENSTVKKSRRPGCGWVATLSLVAAAVILPAGCEEKSPAAAQQAPPPPDVSVARPIVREVVEWDLYTGHLEAPETANVAARVSGLVVEMPFTEGAMVKKGDVLAVIDDRPFKADLDLKLADQHKTESAMSIAKLTFDRLSGLHQSNAVSEQDVDNAQATMVQAQAVVASAKASVELSRLNLEWTRVLSPIGGRVSYKLVTVGNLVTGGGSNQPTLLTTVQSVDPVYCYVHVDEQSVLKYQKLSRERKIASAREGTVPCYVQLGDETDFSREGYIDFVDNHIDPATGTQRVRGVLKNPDGRLTPGFFARLRVPGSGRYQATLVPDNAIGTDQSRRNVLVVDKDNKVVVKPVQLGALFGNLRVIASGITPADRVIVNGQMHVRPGAPAKPTEVPIRIDDRTFTDPGPSVVMATGDASPSTQPAAAPVAAAATTDPSTEPAGN